MATLLQKLTLFVSSFIDLINSLTSPSLTCILLNCKLLVVILSKSPILSSDIILLKMSDLLLHANKLLSQNSLIKKHLFHLMGDVHL